MTGHGIPSAVLAAFCGVVSGIAFFGLAVIKWAPCLGCDGHGESGE